MDKVKKSLKAVVPESKGLKLYCPENILEISIRINPGIVRKRFMNKIAFSSERIINVEVISAPFFDEIKGACCQQDKNSDYILDLSKLGPDCESALLRINYEVNSHEIAKKLVERKWQADVINGDDENTYWMTARLRSLSYLETICGSLELEDVDISVDVGITENVRTSLPKDFIKRVETLGNAINESNREKRMKGLIDYSRQRNAKSESNDFSKIGELKTIFSGRKFRQFVDVDKPFVYSDAEPGMSDGSFGDKFGIPKQVRVTSRTFLGMDKPVAEGYLHYMPSKLNDYIREILS